MSKSTKKNIAIGSRSNVSRKGSMRTNEKASDGIPSNSRSDVSKKRSVRTNGYASDGMPSKNDENAHVTRSTYVEVLKGRNKRTNMQNTYIERDESSCVRLSVSWMKENKNGYNNLTLSIQ